MQIFAQMKNIFSKDKSDSFTQKITASDITVIWDHLKKENKLNKTGLRPVSRPVEQVPLLRWLGVDTKAKQTDRQDRRRQKAEQKDIQVQLQWC